MSSWAIPRVVEPGANINVNGAAGFATTIVNNGSLALDRGSNLTLNANSSWTQNGSMQLDQYGGYSANLVVNSGGAFTYAGSSAINFTDVSPSSNGVYDQILVNGGTFTTNQGITFNQVTSANNFNGIFELTGGGTLALSANIANFFTQGTVSSGSTESLLGNGGAITDTGGYTMRLALPFERRRPVRFPSRYGSAALLRDLHGQHLLRRPQRRRRLSPDGLSPTPAPSAKREQLGDRPRLLRKKRHPGICEPRQRNNQHALCARH